MLITEKYDLGQTLGLGAFSEVKLGVSKASGEKFAIKIIDKAKCKGKENMIETEVNILRKAKHENIIQLYEMHELDNKIYLVMELVTGGELFDEIVSRGKYSEKEASKMIQKILLAVDYLHMNGIVHRDLKPENLLLSEKSRNAKVMISDFGLSKLYNEEIAMKTACGTPGYVAPEVLKRQGYGREVDLWSIGVITYILLSGYPPFYDSNNVELFKKIMAGRYEFDRPWWDNISEKSKDFIRHLLVLDPHARFTTQQALAHPFITQHCEEPKRPDIHTEQNRPASTFRVGRSVSAHAVKAPQKTDNIGRPIEVKSPVADSGCVISNDSISRQKEGAEKKKHSTFGKVTNWFKGRSSNKLDH